MFLSQGSAPSDPRDTWSAHGTAVRCPLPGKMPARASAAGAFRAYRIKKWRRESSQRLKIPDNRRF